MSRIILCEGKHASSALEGLLKSSAFACERWDISDVAPRPSGITPWACRTRGKAVITVYRCGGKDGLFRALELLLGNVPAEPPEAIGVNFDPDTQAEADWRKALERRLGSDGNVSSAVDGRYDVARTSGAHVAVWPMPWPGESLYQAATEALASCEPIKAAKLRDCARAIGASRTDVKALGWTWMAHWFPSAGCDHFFREVMGRPDVQNWLQRVAPLLWNALVTLAR